MWHTIITQTHSICSHGWPLEQHICLGIKFCVGGTVSTSWQEVAHRRLEDPDPAEDQLLLFCTSGPLHHITPWPYSTTPHRNVFQRASSLIYTSAHSAYCIFGDGWGIFAFIVRYRMIWHFQQVWSHKVPLWGPKKAPSHPLWAQQPLHLTIELH